MNGSKYNNKPKAKQSQASQPEHLRDGYIIIHRRILDEGFSAYELSFLTTCLLIAGHRKSKTPGVVKASTAELGQLMGASQKTAWRCKQAMIARGIIEPLASHEFIIVNYEAYQNLARSSLVPQTNVLVPQTKNTNQKGHNFSPTDLPLVPQTNVLVPQTSHKSHRLTPSPTDLKPATNQIAVLNNKRNKYIKEVIAPPTTAEAVLAEISQLYEKNFGLITPILAEKFRDFVENYRGPFKWIRDAFDEAVSNNVRKWAYVERILNTWQAEGRKRHGERKPREGPEQPAAHRRGDRQYSAEELRQSLER